MLELSEIGFKVNTEQVVYAVKQVAALGKAVEELGSSFAVLDKKAAAANKTQADANLKNAKAADIQAKTADTQAKAAERVAKEADKAAKAQDKLTQAAEKAAAADERQTSILQRKKDQLDFVYQGFSHGAASTLAYAKAAGAASDEIADLGKVLEKLRGATGAQPFDKSQGALKSMQTEVQTLTVMTELYNSQMGFTSKQLRQLGVEYNKLDSKMKSQGATTEQVKVAFAGVVTEARTLALEENRLAGNMQKAEKAMRDQANAADFVESEMQRVNFALKANNDQLQRGSSNALVKFESQLKSSGLTLDQQKGKLDEYRGKLIELQKLSEKQKTDYLSRAIAPQITDITVGLMTGQSLMTVMLQQGGQLRDQFGQMGVAGADMAKTMRTALSSMAVSIIDTGKAFAGLFIGGLADIGTALGKYSANMLGVTKVTEYFNNKLTKAAEGGNIFAKKALEVAEGIGALNRALAATAIGAFIVGLALVAKTYYDIIKTEKDLNVALVTTGAQMGLTLDQATAMAGSIANVTGTTVKASAAITEFAKAGVEGGEGMEAMIIAAMRLASVGGPAVADTAKAYAELQDKPVTGLIKLAESTGFVTTQTLLHIESLYEQGRATEAVQAAQEAFRQATEQQAAAIADKLSSVELLWKDIKSAIGAAAEAIYDLIKTREVIDSIRTAWETVAVIITDSVLALNRVGHGITTVIKLANQLAQGNFTGFKQVWEESAAEAANLVDQQAKATASLLNRNKAQVAVVQTTQEEREANAEGAKVVGALIKANDMLSKAEEKNTAKTMDRAKYQDMMLKNFLRDNKIQIDATKALTAEQQQLIDTAKKAAGINWDKAQKKDDSGKKIAKENARDLDAYNDILNKTVGLSSNYNNELVRLSRARERNKITEEQYIEAVKDLIKQQPFYIAQQKEIEEADKIRNRLLGEADGLGRTYEETLKRIRELSTKQDFKGNKLYDEAELKKLEQALFESTPLVKQQNKELEEGSKLMAKMTEEAAKMGLELEKAMQKKVLSDMSPEGAKLQSIEFDAQNKAKETSIALEKQLADIQNSKADMFSKVAAGQLAEETAATKLKTIEAERYQAYRDYVAEFMGSTTDVLGRLADMASASGNISFANAVKSTGGLLTAFDKLAANQLAFNELRKEAGNNEKELTKLNQKQTQATLKSYGDILGAAKGYFKEGSKGYKALGAAEKVFRAFEAAIAIKNAALKIGQMFGVVSAQVAGDKLTAASAVTSAGTIVAAKTAESTAAATAGVLNQAGGDPYTAMPRMVAMAAVMAALGFAVALSGGGSKPATGDGTMSYATGKGTVFGDKDATSESIKNSLSILEDVDSLTMRYSFEMLKSLRSIEKSMTGVTNIILRNNGMETTAAGVIEGTALSGAVGMDIAANIPIIGKILGSLFGTKTTITGQGVYVNDASYEQIRNEDVNAGYYTDVNKKKKFFGITTSDKNSTNYQQSDELSQQFAKILNSFVDTVKSAGSILGVSGEEIDNKLKDFVLKIGKIDLKDLKGDEIKEKLLSVFGAAGDDIARQALAGFEKYQQVGEGYLETIVRVALTVETVRASLDNMNQSMQITVDNAMELADSFGGLENFSEAVGNYISSFYDEAEKNEILYRQLTSAFEAQNTTLPTTKDEYRKLIEAQDLSTEEGRAMYAFLLQLAPAFAQVKDAAEELKKAIADQAYDLDIELLRVQGKEVEAVALERKKELEALRKLDPALADTKQRIYDIIDANAAAEKAAKEKADADKAAADAAADYEKAQEQARKDAEAARKKAMDDAYKVFEQAIKVEQALLKDRMDVVKDSIGVLKSLFDLLEKSVASLYNQVTSTSMMAYANARQYINTAYNTVTNGGKISDAEELSKAVEAAMEGIDKQDYSTGLDEQRDKLRLAAELKLLRDSTAKSLTTEEKNLAALEEQSKKLDETLEYWKRQIDIANGTLIATMSVADAIRNLESAIYNFKSGTNGNSGTPGTPSNPDVVGPGDDGKQPAIQGPGRSDKGWGRQVVTPTGSFWNLTSKEETARLDQMYQTAFVPFDGSGDIVGYLNAVKAAGGTLLDAATLGKWDYRDMVSAADRAGVPRFAGGGRYGGGIAMVGEEGPELINFSNGGQVTPAGQTSNIMETVARVGQLEKSLATQAGLLKAIAENTGKIKDNLRNVTPTGDAISITNKT